MSMSIMSSSVELDSVSRFVLVEQRSLNRRLLLDWLHLAWPGSRVDAVAEPDALSQDPMPVRLALFSFGDAPVRAPHITASIRSLLDRIDEAPLVLLGERHDRGVVADALAIGARGYLPTSLDSPAAARAIEFVLAGGTFVPAEAVLEHSANGGGRNGLDRNSPNRADHWRNNARTELPFLTPREREVAARVCAGKPNKIIAHELSISEATVKVFVRQILSKVGATNRTEAASTIRRHFGEPSEPPARP
jgi:DNA-binding NarL/FixJ family response regulator